MSTTNDDVLAYALAYAGLGWRVIPIRPGSKAPLGIERWQELATSDPGIISAWWGDGGRFAGWGVGLATGRGSGVFVLDVDPRNGGDDTLAELEGMHGALPDTVMACTGGGGLHLVFKWPDLAEGKVLANQAGRLGPGLDLKADGGQVVVAPTIHPETGNAYVWEVEHLPGALPIAEAPAWLLDLATDRAPEQLLWSDDALSTLDMRYAIDRYNGDGDPTKRSVELLTGAGWVVTKTHRHKVFMERPGQSDRGKHGATVGAVAPGVAYVFTDGAPPLGAGHGYRPFDLFALLHHGGDRAMADVALSRQGWGHVTYPEAFDLTGHGLADYITTAKANAEVAASAEDAATGSWGRTDMRSVLTRLDDPEHKVELPTVCRFMDDDGAVLRGAGQRPLRRAGWGQDVGDAPRRRAGAQGRGQGGVDRPGGTRHGHRSAPAPTRCE
jgi:hypothetical protein